MKFIGIGRVFSTAGDGQYETIGAFWDELGGRYGRANLRGLGYGWTQDTISYCIGLKDGVIDGADTEIELPDEGWTTAEGKTAELSGMYADIYRGGPLRYEIETFDGDACRVDYIR